VTDRQLAAIALQTGIASLAMSIAVSRQIAESVSTVEKLIETLEEFNRRRAEGDAVIKEWLQK